MSFTYAIALTGGIATGKSTVIKQLLLSGFHIIDADTIAHEVINEQSDKIKKLFGDAFVKDGKVQRKELGAIVFADNKKRKELESLLHPIIYKQIKEKSDKLDKRAEPYIVDIPLFYEGGHYAIENVIVVYTTQKQQVERLMSRDNYTKEEALMRIDSQIDINTKRDNASYVIDNRGNLNQLEFEVNRVKDEMLRDHI